MAIGVVCHVGVVVTGFGGSMEAFVGFGGAEGHRDGLVVVLV